MLVTSLPLGYWLSAGILVVLVGVVCIAALGRRDRLAAQRAALARKRWVKEPRFPKRPYRMFL